MSKSDLPYIFKFDPILKKKVWGGRKLSELYHKDGGEKIGESWELSGVEDNISKVSNGRLKGTTLTQLIEIFKSDLVGEKVHTRFGKDFPLLFKFIDAREDLSVQLHPNDDLAAERHNSFGKTEMWYILNTEKEARLILGFNQKMTEEKYLKFLTENKITEILHTEKVTRGDAYYVKPGTVHAIGGGVLLAEIQQTSDITYRIYDWNRPDTNGKPRELHTEMALAAIDFNAPTGQLRYSEQENAVVNICKSPYFETNKLKLSETFERDLTSLHSFVVYMCIEGAATLKSENFSEEIICGQTVLIPAIFKNIRFSTSNATFLEVYVP